MSNWNMFCVVVVISLLNVVLSQSSDFEKIFKGRCTIWGKMNGVEKLPCDKFWTDFEAVLTNEDLKKICVMEPERYTPVVNAMLLYVTEIKTNGFFWSKTKSSAVDLCKQLGLFTCLESTLPGFILDGLDWCDKTLIGDKVYETQCGCSGQAEMVWAYWKSLSKPYAMKLSGEVGVLLNGSIPTPFQKNSTFGSVEVPNIMSPRITHLTAYLARNIEDDAVRTTCNSKSMEELKSIITEQGVNFTCVEDPPFVRHYLCIRNPTHHRCVFNFAQAVTTWVAMAFLPFICSRLLR